MGVLDLAQIPVDFQHEFREIIGLFFHAQVSVELGLLHHLPDLGLQRGKLGRIQGLALVMLVHELLQPGDVAVGVSGGHGRDEVVDDGGVGAAFGLGALTGVVDDERIEERYVVQGHLGIAGLGETDALARQPFQGAVLADVYHGIGLENVTDPAVVGDVVVCRREIRVVVDRNRVLAETARGLQAHENVAHGNSGDGQAVAGAVHLAGRVAPGIHQFGANRFRETRVPTGVVAAFDMAGCQTKLLLSQAVGVVAATLDDALDQLIAVGRDVFDHVPGAFQGLEQVDSRRRSVEANRVADASVLGGIVAEDDGDALVGVGLAAESRVTRGESGQVVHAVRLGDVALHTARG